MRLLANENIPGPLVGALIAAEHDVCWARKDMPGAQDSQLLARAQSEARILLTFDKDFGELAFRAGLPATCGIILLRLPLVSPDLLSTHIPAVLQSRSDWSGNFAVVEPDRIRMRPLPSALSQN